MEYHTPVLLKESIDSLDIQAGETYLDCTLGNGGHAEEVWKRYGNQVTIAGIDADSQAVEIARERLEKLGAKPKFAVLNFRNTDKATEILEIEQPTAILMDLGWNAKQFEEAGKGFGFDRDEPLKMTYGEGALFTAEEIVNSWDEENLRTIISAYGEERLAGRIARAITEKREEKPIKTSAELSEIIKQAVPVWYRFGRLHPATRTFQALRIAVNDELRALEEGLGKAFEILKQEGRLAVITFHSLEDRIVKNFFKELENKKLAQIINKKPITPTEEEVEANRRSRSAKLRTIKKI
jgi:16S rRNA (cytosine1402-N4)-methyltransferase